MAINFDKAAQVWTLSWDADWVTAVSFFGTGRRLAAGNNLGQVLVWELPEKAGDPTPAPLLRLDGHTNVISRLLPAPDGKSLLSASYDHSIRIWDAQTTGSGPATVALNARTRDDLIRRRASKVPTLVEVSVKTQQATQVLTAHPEWVSDMKLTPDGKFLVSGDDSGNVIVWDYPAGKELRRWTTTAWVYALAVSPDGKQAFVSERRPLVFDSGRHAGAKLWDVATGKVQAELDATLKGMYISAAAYSLDGKVLAIGRGGELDGMNGKVYLIDPATGKKTAEFSPGHQYGVTDLVFHPDGKHLASSGRDTTVKIWEVPGGKMVKELSKPRGGQFKDWVHAISFSRDGQWLAAADMAGAVQVWSFQG